MTTMASQITSLTVVYLTVYSDADQRKHQSSASLAFVWGIHRDRRIPHTKVQLRGKCFHSMTSSWIRVLGEAGTHFPKRFMGQLFVCDEKFNIFQGVTIWQVLAQCWAVGTLGKYKINLKKSILIMRNIDTDKLTNMALLAPPLTRAVSQQITRTISPISQLFFP